MDVVREINTNPFVATTNENMTMLPPPPPISPSPHTTPKQSFTKKKVRERRPTHAQPDPNQNQQISIPPTPQQNNTNIEQVVVSRLVEKEANEALLEYGKLRSIANDNVTLTTVNLKNMIQYSIDPKDPWVIQTKRDKLIAISNRSKEEQLHIANEARLHSKNIVHNTHNQVISLQGKLLDNMKYHLAMNLVVKECQEAADSEKKRRDQLAEIR
jgi:hypothetical protein